MSQTVQGLLTVLARVMLSAIFLADVVGNKIPNFAEVAKQMASAGVPAPEFLLVGATIFLIAGSLSVITGYRARIGAALLLVFLVLATYYFHNFWDLSDPKAKEAQTIQFLKNLSMMGAMLFIIANGPGPMSLGAKRRLNPATR